MTSCRREEEPDGGRARPRGRHQRSLSGNVTNNRRAGSRRINRRWVRGMGGGATGGRHGGGGANPVGIVRRTPGGDGTQRRGREVSGGPGCGEVRYDSDAVRDDDDDDDRHDHLRIMIFSCTVAFFSKFKLNKSLNLSTG